MWDWWKYFEIYSSINRNWHDSDWLLDWACAFVWRYRHNNFSVGCQRVETWFIICVHIYLFLIFHIQCVIIYWVFIYCNIFLLLMYIFVYCFIYLTLYPPRSTSLRRGKIGRDMRPALFKPFSVPAIRRNLCFILNGVHKMADGF